MRKMKIDSKNDYMKNRVCRGNHPHRMLEMVQKQALENNTKIESRIRSNHSIIYGKTRGEIMSIRSIDHCSCGHNRENHDNFNGECEEYQCKTFHREIRTKNIVAE